MNISSGGKIDPNSKDYTLQFLKSGNKINLGINIFFKSNKIDVEDEVEALKKLEPLAKILNSSGDYKVNLSGNSNLDVTEIVTKDEKIDMEHLLKGRAESLKKLLVDKLKVDSNKINIVPGKKEMLSKNHLQMLQLLQIRLIIFLFLLNPCVLIGQSHVIKWNGNNSLRVDSFIGSLQLEDSVKAYSTFTLNSFIFLNNDSFFFKIEPVFHKSKSFFNLNKIGDSSFIIEHEQIHFDIYKLASLRLCNFFNSKMDSLLSFNKTLFKVDEKIIKFIEDYIKIYSRTELEKINLEFDSEIKKNQNMQKAWKIKINKEIQMSKVDIFYVGKLGSG